MRGEAASGYYSDLGLKRFDRHFLYIAPDYFIVWDELETEKPSDFTFLLNADREIKLNKNTADFINETAALRVIRVAPNEAKSSVAPQMIQARGLPGSVDKGNSEQRGVQLQTVSTEKQKKFEFLHFLQPISSADKTPAPKIERTTSGLKIFWANGDEDSINLRAGMRSIERRRRGKTLPKMILQNRK